MKLIKPAPIKKGDIAYVISPSAGIFPFAEGRVVRAKENLEKLGLTVKIAEHADKNAGYISSSIEERVSDIHDVFRDKDCSLIIASIGGNHSNQLIEKLDYDLIRNNPKTFVGYSDNTVLHLAMLSQAKLQSYYGPCFLNQFGEFPSVPDYTLNDFRKVVLEKEHARTIQPSVAYTDEVLDWFTAQDAIRPRKQVKNMGYDWWIKGSATGWALAGAIPSINHVLGSKYMPDPTGSILFIDIPEGSSMHEGMSIADVDAWLTDLANADVLSRINGLVVGRPYKYDQKQINELKKVVLRVMSIYGVPVLFGADFGHTDPMIAIPYGATVLLDSKNDQLSFT